MNVFNDVCICLVKKNSMYRKCGYLPVNDASPNGVTGVSITVEYPATDLYTPNLGLGIAVSVRDRERGRFKGNSEKAGRAQKGPKKKKEQRGSTREHEGTVREHRGSKSLEGAFWGSAGAQQAGA